MLRSYVTLILYVDLKATEPSNLILSDCKSKNIYELELVFGFMMLGLSVYTRSTGGVKYNGIESSRQQCCVHELTTPKVVAYRKHGFMYQVQSIMGMTLKRATNLSDVVWLDVIWALGPEAPIIVSARIMSDHFLSAHSIKVR